ncbi:MAG: histidinol-phosphate transaminase [Bacteroidota bacterium]
MDKINSYFKPSVLELRPYSSARDEYDGTEGIFLDANENAFDFEYKRYPDPYQKNVKEHLGKWRQIDPKSIFLGNGSDEIIDLLIRSTSRQGEDRILTLDPSYGMYRVSAAINEIPLDLVQMNSDLTVNQDDVFNKMNDRHKLIFICSPNNPNGGIIDSNLIEKILQKSGGLVIVDEAYIDFSDTSSWITRLKEYKNLVVMQTFSKSLGAAGIRLGMAFMNPGLVAILNKIKPPYNISIPNQLAALDRMNKMEAVQEAIEEIKAQREFLRQALGKMEMVKEIFPSQANFLLVRFQKSELVFEQLKKRKIIVRDRSREKFCEGCLRITIGNSEQNQMLLKALEKINQNELITV